MKNSRELNAYLSHIAASAGWDEPAGDGAAVAVPRKLYRVSEIAVHLGLTRQTLHNYATIGLITEERRTNGGQRLFDESVFERLALVQRLKRTHRLHEIRRMLDDDMTCFAADVATMDAPALPAAIPARRDLARPGARSVLERSQDIASLAHLADDTPQSIDKSVAPPPHEGEIAQGPKVVAVAPEEFPKHREKETPADEHADN
jgi:DNA-binding transcriptional MerR regulator